jgi:general L-amino acid transport system substrate-binding protein
MKSTAFIAALVLGVAATPAIAGITLDKIKKLDAVVCGVAPSTDGYSAPDSTGKYIGFDVDICRAIAAAVLGSAEKVKYVPLTAQQRFTALQSGEVEILSRQTTATQQRDTALGLNFAPVVYYDGQGFMVPAKLGVKSARELNGATVCVSPGTTTELNLADYFRSNKMDFKPVVIEDANEVRQAFFAGRCDVFTTDASALASVRATKASNAADYIILPEIISKEPLAPVVRHGDDEWADIVRWVIYALIDAEENGITSKNVPEMAKSDNPGIKRLLGATPGMGKNLGLDEQWAARAIQQVGNYGEIFERNLGKGSALKLDRALNAQWTKGGLMYAWPFR